MPDSTSRRSKLIGLRFATVERRIPLSCYENWSSSMKMRPVLNLFGIRGLRGMKFTSPLPEFDWSGPDDLWPPEPVVLPEPEEPKTTTPETVVTRQWGLRLPSGEVVWNEWQGISFGTPLDRLRMVATLQKTMMDIGFKEGEQVDDIVSRYSWATRDQIAEIVYRDTGIHPLTATEASETRDVSPVATHADSA